MRLLIAGIVASAITVAFVTPVQLGCMASACPLPKTSALTITPQVPSCLQTTLSSCLHPTLELKNGCDDALYVPVDYGIFVEQVQPGTELEVRSKQNLTFEVKPEKATARSSQQEDYAIPIRLGKDTHTLTFSISADS